MIKLKDVLLEHPSDFTDDDIDIIDLIRRKQKYDQFDGKAGASESVKESKQGEQYEALAGRISEKELGTPKTTKKVLRVAIPPLNNHTNRKEKHE